MKGSPLRLAILWHMHQPDYRDPRTGMESMPWVRLHALKDYYDMARLVEEAPPGIRVTFNLTPVLLLQLEDLVAQGSRDPFTRAGRKPIAQLTALDKGILLRHYFSVNEERMLRPLDRYAWLHEQVKAAGERVEEMVDLFSPQDYLDLQTLFALAWSGRTLREKPLVRRLLAKGRNFTEEERDALLTLQDGFLEGVLPLYRRLQEEGRIEISVTPLYHPILPLLCDLQAAREANPSCSVEGLRFRHPEDAREQVRRARELGESWFGRKPTGMWPSEGSVSDEAVGIASQEGVTWMATDVQVLHRSMRLAGMEEDPRAHLHPWRLPGGNSPALFFRDTTLSDLIGFTWSRWDPREAARNFVARARNLSQEVGPDPACLPVILDGENAWEYYTNHGSSFLSALYQEIASAPDLRAVTFQEAMDEVPCREIPSLKPGSWIRADFDTWAGHPEKNRAWMALIEARAAWEDQRQGGASSASLSKAREFLLRAEGSDWFWWLGDDHFTTYKREFDELFRRNVMAVWTELGLSPPRWLEEPIPQDNGTAAAEAREPFQLIRPCLDGEALPYYEWIGAGWFDVAFQKGAIFTGEPLIKRVHYGFDEENLYLRLTPREGRADEGLRGACLTLFVRNRETQSQKKLRLDLNEAATHVQETERPPLRHRAARVWEIGVPLARLEATPGEVLHLHMEISTPSGRWERLPLDAAIRMTVPPPEFNRIMWVL